MFRGVVQLTEALANDRTAVMCTGLLMYVVSSSKWSEGHDAVQSDKRYKRRRKLQQFPAACPKHVHRVVELINFASGQSCSCESDL